MLKRRKLFYKSVIALLMSTTLATPIFADEKMVAPNQEQLQVQKQKVEVVFVLDTTGSMGALIEGAKQKIWHIATEIQNAKSDVEVRMGLIAYRDRGDEYVTQHFPITDDINEVYANLIDFRAGGGGDHPESVNQALNEAVLQQNWSSDADALKMIFLVGDAPPKMNYQDDVKYMESVKMARAADINVNTILAGNDHNTKFVWNEIAQHGNGAFSQIEQDGNVTIIATPYDDEIHQLNIEMSDTIISYGSAEIKGKMAKKKQAVRLAKPSASADMNEYNAGSGYASPMGAKDELNFTLNASKTLEDGSLITEYLPEKMQKMTKDEKVKYIEEKQAKRKEIQAKLKSLNEKRKAYKKDALAKQSKGEKQSLDQQLIDIIHNQAKAKNIKY